MNPTDLPPRGPSRWALLLGLALATVALELAAITQYGYFRDELYYLASTDHLAWGYVEHPPLSIAILALVRRVLGDSLVALRIVPALAGAATVLLTGLIARELGGGRFAQSLACLAAMLAPGFLGTAHVFSMNVFDLLLWTLATLLLLRTLRSGRPGGWIALGLVLGLGLLNKISVLWLGAGILAGLLLTPYRRALRTPWPYVAGLLAAALFLPHVLWQAAHGWPTLEFMHNAATRKMVAVSVSGFVVGQLLEMGPINVGLWLPGLGYALFARPGRPWRILAWIYLTVAVVLLAVGRSRASYLTLAYPMLLALGGVALERAAARPPWQRLRAPALALVLLGGLVPLPFALPVLPVETFIRYQKALRMAPSTEEHLQVGPLPQHYADMFGWEELTALVAKAYGRLTPEEQAHCRVFGQNYGEAGAIDVLGRRYGLPHALSGHNSYWLWGPGDWDGGVLIIIGGRREDNAAYFERLEVVGATDSRYAMPYERGLEVSIGRRLKLPVHEAWPQLRFYI